MPRNIQEIGRFPQKNQLNKQISLIYKIESSKRFKIQSATLNCKIKLVHTNPTDIL